MTTVRCYATFRWRCCRFCRMVRPAVSADGVYTVDQNERAVKTSFGRAVRVPGGKTTLDDPIAESLRPEERARYYYPQVRVIPPGGPYFKMPWEKIHKVSIATMTVNMALDLEDPSRQRGRHAAGSGHQRPAQYRPHRPDPLPREREPTCTRSCSASRSRSCTSWPISSPCCGSASPISKPSRMPRRGRRGRPAPCRWRAAR